MLLKESRGGFQPLQGISALYDICALLSILSTCFTCEVILLSFVLVVVTIIETTSDVVETLLKKISYISQSWSIFYCVFVIPFFPKS